MGKPYACSVHPLPILPVIILVSTPLPSLQLPWLLYAGGHRSRRLKVTEESSEFSMERGEGAQVRLTSADSDIWQTHTTTQT